MRARTSTIGDAKEVTATSKTRFLSRAGLGLPKYALPRWIKQFNSKGGNNKTIDHSLSVNDADNDADSVFVTSYNPNGKLFFIMCYLRLMKN